MKNCRIAHSLCNNAAHTMRTACVRDGKSASRKQRQSVLSLPWQDRVTHAAVEHNRQHAPRVLLGRRTWKPCTGRKMCAASRAVMSSGIPSR